ncbi:MAG: hypothetical protein HMLKMBBP_00286 [Planctomycetes bacterium]|nr:hypothetical protein [Planctomycetota bacterium]
MPDPAPAFRPLLKWPGGKAREWPELAPHLPRRIRNFADPFMGGLAPFARTPFEGRAFLNDRHARLVDLHLRVQREDRDLYAALSALSRSWDALSEASRELAPVFASLVAGARKGAAPSAGDALPAASEVVRGEETPVIERIAASLADKASRVARLETRHAVTFGRAQLAEHCETAVRSGFYFHVRDREGRPDAPGGPAASATADFLFLREFCYGSMFRHNARGAFNIPYGGTSYNVKRLAPRIEQMASPATRAALARAEFRCGDFEPFLRSLTLGRGDFVFADPPYDSDFRSYGKDAFSPEDHARLAAALAGLPCPWMLVIKETDLVRRTYLSPAMRKSGAREVHAFGKTYGYNVRGRNERAARHLVIACRPSSRHAS